MQDNLSIKKISLKNKQNYYGLQLNVFLTKDKKLICIQDIQSFSKTLAVEDIQKTSLDNLYSIFDNNTKHFDTPSEFIKQSNTEDKVLFFNIENTSPSDIPFILNELDRLSILKNNVIISSERDILLAVREKDANISIMLKADNFTPEDYLFLILNKASYMLKYTSLTKERIDQLHQMNIKVNAYNIKETKDQDIAELLVYWNVDMITEI